MRKQEDRSDMTRDMSFWISEAAFVRFQSFCDHVLGVTLDHVPTQQTIFMRQNFSVLFYATILFLMTNGFYLVKNIAMNTMLPIDMIPLYMMVSASLAMLLFSAFYKDYGSSLARFAQLAFYAVVIASVTVFMVSCNYHKIGLSISMCYLFAIMAAPPYKAVDTVVVCALIVASWWLPGQLPYAENYDLLKHFLLRFSVVVGLIALRSIFLRQTANERTVLGMSNSFLKLAYNDVMTGTLNKKAMDTYCKYIVRKLAPEKVSVIICDIDNFKSYNDHYSHLKGDEALKHFAGSIIAVLEASDRYLFRFGGEEFVVILPDADEEEARCVAVELLGAVRAAAISRDDLPGRSIVTASFGVACGSCAELNDLSLVAKADKQLYLCKSGGKDCAAAGDTIYR